MAKQEIIVEKVFEPEYAKEFYDKPKIVMFRPVPVDQEPVLTNRFAVEFEYDFELESYLVQTATLPKFKNGNWQNIKIEFIDVTAPSTSAKLYALMNRLNEDGLFQEEHQVFIKHLNPVGEVISRWLIVFNKIDIDFGNLSYSNSKLHMLKMIIKPIRCIFWQP